MLGNAGGAGQSRIVRWQSRRSIAGASQGKGLGALFLRHLQRTRLLLHLVDCSDLPLEPPEVAWRIIRDEVASHSAELAARPTILVATKVEDEASRQRAQALATATGQSVLPISSATGAGLRDLVHAVSAMLSSLPKSRPV